MKNKTRVVRGADTPRKQVNIKFGFTEGFSIGGKDFVPLIEVKNLVEFIKAGLGECGQGLNVNWPAEAVDRRPKRKP